MSKFDPKDIYSKLNIRSLIGEKLRYEVQLKVWPCDEIAYIRLFTDDGRSGWVLVAPGTTPESVANDLRAVAGRLTPDRSRCGGDACGL